jgi:hypothetical protein
LYISQLYNRLCLKVAVFPRLHKKQSMWRVYRTSPLERVTDLPSRKVHSLQRRHPLDATVSSRQLTQNCLDVNKPKLLLFACP